MNRRRRSRLDYSVRQNQSLDNTVASAKRVQLERRRGLLDRHSPSQKILCRRQLVLVGSRVPLPTTMVQEVCGVVCGP